MIPYDTVAEAALKAKRHPETLRDALRAGELHGGQAGRGGSWRIREDCLEAWLSGEKCAHRGGERIAA